MKLTFLMSVSFALLQTFVRLNEQLQEAVLVLVLSYVGSKSEESLMSGITFVCSHA